MSAIQTWWYSIDVQLSHYIHRLLFSNKFYNSLQTNSRQWMWLPITGSTAFLASFLSAAAKLEVCGDEPMFWPLHTAPTTLVPVVPSWFMAVAEGTDTIVPRWAACFMLWLLGGIILMLTASGWNFEPWTSPVSERKKLLEF